MIRMEKEEGQKMCNIGWLCARVNFVDIKRTVKITAQHPGTRGAHKTEVKSEVMCCVNFTWTQIFMLSLI